MDDDADSFVYNHQDEQALDVCAPPPASPDQPAQVSEPVSTVSDIPVLTADMLPTEWTRDPRPSRSHPTRRSCPLQTTTVPATPRAEPVRTGRSSDTPSCRTGSIMRVLPGMQNEDQTEMPDTSTSRAIHRQIAPMLSTRSTAVPRNIARLQQQTLNSIFQNPWQYDEYSSTRGMSDDEDAYEPHFVSFQDIVRSAQRRLPSHIRIHSNERTYEVRFKRGVFCL